MISKFLASKFSGYIAIAGVVAVLGLVLYIYKEGKNSCAGAAAVETIKVDQQSRKDAYGVQKEIQALDEPALNSKLCSLGIVRQNRNCK